MTLRFVVAAAACIGFAILATYAFADGMPGPEDGFNPVRSVPGKPAPGVTQPPPIKETTAPAPQPPASPAAESKPDKPAPEAPEPAATQPSAAATPPPAATPPAAATPAPAAAPAPAATPQATTASVKKPVYEISSVVIEIAERKPPIGVVTVKGVVRTGGWKDVELKPLQTFAPEVGMRSFTLVGTPPSGPATQALTPISAMIRIDPLPDDVKTIRVLGETNEVAQTFR